MSEDKEKYDEKMASIKAKHVLKIDLSKHDAKIRADAIEEVEELIRAFVKEWNMENHKRISYVASDELISYIRVHIKDHNPDLKEMENANE